MISAASKDALKKKLDGCQVEWQLTDRSELEVKDRVDDLKDLPDIKTSGNGILKFEGHAV
jgi:cofilin